MTITIAPPMFLQFLNPNNTGAPAAGFQLFTYIAGTSTKQATWTDSTRTVQNANPLPLDSNGVGNVWGDPTLAYKFVWAPPNDTDPPTSPIRTVDNLYFPLSSPVLTQGFLGAILYPQIWPSNEVAFTPVIAFGASGSITQTVQAATFSQLGNVVTFSFRINWSAVASPAGNVTVTGLPLAPKAGGPDVVCSVYSAGITIAAGYLALPIFNATTTGLLYNVQTTTAQVQGSAFAATGSLIASGSYQV